MRRAAGTSQGSDAAGSDDAEERCGIRRLARREYHDDVFVRAVGADGEALAQAEREFFKKAAQPGFVQEEAWVRCRGV
jgi:hypothetical protein